MAGALCCSWCHREILAAATGRKPMFRKREGSVGGTLKKPHTTAGGVCAKSLQRGKWERGQDGERVQDAPGCKSGHINITGHWLLIVKLLKKIYTVVLMIPFEFSLIVLPVFWNLDEASENNIKQAFKITLSVTVQTPEMVGYRFWSIAN